MAAVDADQNLIGDRSRQQALSVSEVARTESRIDADLVITVGELIENMLRQTEPPILGVVGRSIRNEIRLNRQRVQSVFQVRQRHPSTHWNAIVHDLVICRA